jgi:hypothetical protein
MSGEEIHALGIEGARRAKVWLEATTRVHAPWVNPSGVEKLTFAWANGTSFSFDLGGSLRGEDLAGKEFFAESKFYKEPGDQGTSYREYLAKCYRAYSSLPNRCDVFMWITWSPFLVQSWPKLRTPAFVREAVVQHAERVFGAGGAEEISDETCTEVANRLWLFVMSEELERLVLTADHRSVVEAHIVRGGNG